MKKTTYILMLLIMVGLAFAQTQPPYTDPLRFTGTPSMTVAPPPPSTGTSTGCTSWTIRTEKCDGNFRIYEQCIETISGGVWNYKSEDCTEHNGSCSNGVCVDIPAQPSPQQPPPTSSSSKTWIIIGIIVLILFLIWRKK